MKKALIVITADNYIRNYLRTDAFTELYKVVDCDFIADARIKNTTDLEAMPGFRGYYSISDRDRALHDFHFSLMMWRYRRRSKTFTYRWLRNSGWHRVNRTGSYAKRFVSFFSWFIGSIRNPHGLRIPLLGNAVLFPIVAGILRKRLTVNPEIELFFQQKPYDVAIFPSAAFDAATVDTIRLGKRERIPTLCLIDNWDNLTSKTVFWKLPDFIGVWGNQAKEQAVRIHGFHPEQAVPIGTPRFNTYFESRKHKLKSHYSFPYILFVGSAMPFDELGALHRLERIILQSADGQPDLRIVYRPHPWQQKRLVNAVFEENDFEIVVLDSQIKEAYQDGVVPEKTDEKFQPALDYYPALLTNAALVVGPLTTMLLEAALALRPVVGLSYFDGHHANTGLRYFSHFKGTESIPGFTICESEDSLSASVVNALSAGVISETESDAATRYFIFQDSRSYSRRLADLVSDLIKAE